MRDTLGNVVKKEEYKGRFRQSSINSCRRSIVNEILHEKENNEQINSIIRGALWTRSRNILFPETGS